MCTPHRKPVCILFVKTITDALIDRGFTDCVISCNLLPMTAHRSLDRKAGFRMQGMSASRRTINSTLTLRFSVTGPHPSPPPLRQGRENLNSVTIYRISLPCRSGGGLGWGPVTEKRRVSERARCRDVHTTHSSATARTSPGCRIQVIVDERSSQTSVMIHCRHYG